MHPLWRARSQPSVLWWERQRLEQVRANHSKLIGERNPQLYIESSSIKAEQASTCPHAHTKRNHCEKDAPLINSNNSELIAASLRNHNDVCTDREDRETKVALEPSLTAKSIPPRVGLLRVFSVGPSLGQATRRFGAWAGTRARHRPAVQAHCRTLCPG